MEGLGNLMRVLECRQEQWSRIYAILCAPCIPSSSCLLIFSTSSSITVPNVTVSKGGWCGWLVGCKTHISIDFRCLCKCPRHLTKRFYFYFFLLVVDVRHAFL